MLIVKVRSDCTTAPSSSRSVMHLKVMILRGNALIYIKGAAYFSLAYFLTTTLSPPGTCFTCWGTLSPPPRSCKPGIWTGWSPPQETSGSRSGGPSGAEGMSNAPGCLPQPLPPWTPLWTFIPSLPPPLISHRINLHWMSPQTIRGLCTQETKICWQL